MTLKGYGQNGDEMVWSKRQSKMATSENGDNNLSKMIKRLKRCFASIVCPVTE